MLWKFEDNLFQNIALIRALILKSRFEFGPYRFFEVIDRKKRLIVSAPYKDRIIHWVLYEYMYDIFVKSFIYDTFWNIKLKWTNYAVLPRKTTQRKIRKSILSNDLPRITSYNWVLKDTDSYLKIFVKKL